MLALMVFEFYQSATGANAAFVPKYENTTIRSDLGSNVLEFLGTLESSVEVKNEELNQPEGSLVTPTPTVSDGLSFPIFQP